MLSIKDECQLKSLKGRILTLKSKHGVLLRSSNRTSCSVVIWLLVRVLHDLLSPVMSNVLFLRLEVSYLFLLIFDALLVSDGVKLIKHLCHGSTSRNFYLRIADWSRSSVEHYISGLLCKLLLDRNLLLDALNWSLVHEDVFYGIMSMSRNGYRCMARDIML